MRFIRTLFALTLIAAALAAGIRAAPLWFYLLLVVIFTAAYVAGKRHAWRPLLHDASKLISALLATLLVQALVVAVLYGIGYGVAGLFGL